jgi:hypothetical protein
MQRAKFGSQGHQGPSLNLYERPYQSTPKSQRALQFTKTVMRGICADFENYLTRRPCHLPASQKVYVEVIHGLLSLHSVLNGSMEHGA